MSKRDQRRGRVVVPRRLEGRVLRQNFIIFCEGETETGYFNECGKRAKTIGGGDALGIVQKAVALKIGMRKTYDQYWVVFDKDDCQPDRFHEAIALAAANNIRVAWSNQAFELWIILHYRFVHQAMNRNAYEKEIRKYLSNYDASEKSEQHGKDLHRKTWHLHELAMTNAAKGYAQFSDKPDALKESSTLIYRLVEEIKKNL